MRMINSALKTKDTPQDSLIQVSRIDQFPRFEILMGEGSDFLDTVCRICAEPP